jgi:hypothetical protein
MPVARKSAPIVLAVLALGALSGCSGGTTTPTPTVSRTVTAAPSTPSATATGTPSDAATASSGAAGSGTTTASGAAAPAASCGPTSPAGQTAAAASRIALPTGLTDARWDVAGADTSGYDPCAALSWVLLGLDGSTGGSPWAVLLFHDGRYLGTATKEQYGFHPDVARSSASAVRVTYHYPEPGESVADASGRTTATYTWDAAARRVVMSGNVPPLG